MSMNFKNNRAKTSEETRYAAKSVSLSSKLTRSAAYNYTKVSCISKKSCQRLGINLIPPYHISLAGNNSFQILWQRNHL